MTHTVHNVLTAVQGAVVAGPVGIAHTSVVDAQAIATVIVLCTHASSPRKVTQVKGLVVTKQRQ